MENFSEPQLGHLPLKEDPVFLSSGWNDWTVSSRSARLTIRSMVSFDMNRGEDNGGYAAFLVIRLSIGSHLFLIANMEMFISVIIWLSGVQIL